MPGFNAPSFQPPMPGVSAPPGFPPMSVPPPLRGVNAPTGLPPLMNGGTALSGFPPVPGVSASSGIRPISGFNAPSGNPPRLGGHMSTSITNGVGAQPIFPPTPGVGAPSATPPILGVSASSGAPFMANGVTPSGYPPPPPPGYPPMPGVSASSGFSPMPGVNASSGFSPMPGVSSPSGYPPMPGVSASSGFPPMPGVSAPSGFPPMPAVGAPSMPGVGAPRAPFGGLPPPMANDDQRTNLKYEDKRPVDLLLERSVLSRGPIDPPKIDLPHIVENPRTNCDPNVFRCTLTAVPQTHDLLKKSRLPLGLVLHPFRDLKNLNVIQTSVIVRCRTCRTYINPFIVITDPRHWKCNICYRTNDLPDEFNWDPATRSFGDPQRRPEIKHATVEFIAPGEYMPVRKNMQGHNELRQPQPAVYVFVLDVSAQAAENGYLHSMCQRLLENLDRLPGDERTMISFITVDSGVHFYQFKEADVPPTQLIVTDLEDMFLPSMDGLLVKRADFHESIELFLSELPSLFQYNHCTHNALGAAVTIAHKLIADFGGRITVIQTVLPDVGPGALKSREDPNLRAANEVPNLGPASDFYKRLALECSGHQVAIDLFLLNTRYADLATLSEMARFCGGVVEHFPGVHLLRNPLQMRRFERAIDRYLNRKIGFEAVLRIRCSRGLALHTFHGNFFVRSTDLLALPNVNPDSALGVQVEMEENLTDCSYVSFQAALLYTSSKGDRRIRVHTLCLPVINNLGEVHSRVDVPAVLSMLSKLAVDRSLGGSITDAREALVNAAVDALGAFSRSLPSSLVAQGLMAPNGPLRLMPLHVLGMLKHSAFGSGSSVKLDDRFAAMSRFRTMAVDMLLLEIYPALYPLHALDETNPQEELPPRLHLSFEKIDRHGVYLLDTGSFFYLYVGQAVSDTFCSQLFGVSNFARIDEDVMDLPIEDTPLNSRVKEFVANLNTGRPVPAPVRIIREDSPSRELFVRRLVDDKSELSYGYVEFLQHIRREISR